METEGFLQFQININVLVSSSWLCYGSTAIRNILILQVRVLSLNFRVRRLQMSDLDI